MTTAAPEIRNIMDDQAEQYRGGDTDLDWKAMWLCEVYRGDHGFEETYTVAELDRAREQLAGWSKSKDKLGNITAEFQS